ncbi:6-phosphogluconolactonase [Lactobacillus sp. CBA3605]|uniref:lactonase family protein n=1 Tax=Lactobacillus sp. CBA3605 TaxID=2099788 RepID=UPI000CFB278E|nr:lactonase family protein [Lactobacillus sp. CBA3605]AVK60673.1 6-phosphogluconolactonase [Lactobacillus sp. CBA3605]
MQEKILFGTYTKKTSQGIYQGTLDTTAKTLTNDGLLAKTANPTYLALSAKNRLYSVAKDADQGGVAAWQLTDQGATPLNKVVAPGTPPAYVAVDEARQLVYSANYHQGTASVMTIAENGDLTLVDQLTHTGNGPRPEQDSAHIHYTDLTPDNRLVAIDLGSDKVYVYNVSAAGKLTAQSVLTLTPGFGPRHLVFTPDGTHALLAGELSSQVASLAYDSATGSFMQLGTVKTIPEDYTDHNGAAAIRLSNDGHYLYVSNRGYNSLAVFAVAADAHLTLIQEISTEGDFPRDFDLDATEAFVVVVNQNTDNATLYERDLSSGKLSLLQKDLTVPEGVCVLFAK